MAWIADDLPTDQHTNPRLLDQLRARLAASETRIIDQQARIDELEAALLLAQETRRTFEMTAANLAAGETGWRQEVARLEAQLAEAKWEVAHCLDVLAERNRHNQQLEAQLEQARATLTSRPSYPSLERQLAEVEQRFEESRQRDTEKAAQPAQTAATPDDYDAVSDR